MRSDRTRVIRDQRPFPMRIVDPDPILRFLETLLDVVQTDHDERVEGGDPIREAAWDSEEKTAKQGPNTTGKIVRKKRVNDRNARRASESLDGQSRRAKASASRLALSSASPKSER